MDKHPRTKRTVAELIAELQKFNPLCLCEAYEGEVQGIVVVDPSNTCDGVIHNDRNRSTEIPDAIRAPKNSYTIVAGGGGVGGAADSTIGSGGGGAYSK